MASKVSKAFYNQLYKNLTENGFMFKKDLMPEIYQILCRTCKEYILNGNPLTLFGVGVLRLNRKNGKVRNRITGKAHGFQYYYVVFSSAQSFKDEIRILSQTMWKNEQELREERLGYGEVSD